MTELNDFFTELEGFLTLIRYCDISELDGFWETAKYIFTKASRLRIQN